MKKRRALSIRAKLTIAFLFVYLIPVMAILIILSRQLETTFEKIALPRLKNALQAIDTDFAANKRATLELTVSIARNRHLIEAAAEYEYRPADLIHEVDWLGKTTRLDIVRVVNRDGLILASSLMEEGFNTTLDDPNIPGAFSSGTKSDIRIENFHDSETLSINAYCPIKYRGRTEAVLVGSTVVDRTYLRRLNSLSSAHINLFSGYSLLESFPSNDEPASIGKSFLTKIESDREHTEMVSLKGQQYMLGGLPIRVSQGRKPAGFFVLGVSREQINSIKEKTIKDIFYISIVGFGISLILAALFSLGITRPISALVRSARLIGRGRFLEAHISQTSGDEIGILAQAINKMIADLREYSEKLAMSERVAAWREIARRIAHEIKNPLSPIQLSIENLKDAYQNNKREFDAMFPECTDTMLEEVDKLKRLANEFSEFARLPRPHFEKVDAGELLENVASLHGRSSENIRVSFTRDEDGPLNIRGDRDQLNRVFTNLVKNAVEAMPDGGDLKIMARRLNGEIFVIIEDTGEGMERDELQKIFTPYYTTKKTGSGLGLSIVQRIMQDHEAGIDVYSEKGAGTKFILAFKELDERADTGGL